MLTPFLLPKFNTIKLDGILFKSYGDWKKQDERLKNRTQWVIV